MKVKVLNESGYEEAALGFSLSYNSTIERAKEILPKFAFGVPGENKFLEQMIIWLDVTAPRFWWQEADTYRVGNSKQSASTMHTLTKRELTQEDFDPGIPWFTLSQINNRIEDYKNKHIGLDVLKAMLPEGFVQRRIWCLNYKCLQNIYIQRKNHKLPQWKYFLNTVLAEIQYPEFIRPKNNEE